MSGMSVKSVLDAEFSQMNSEKKKKVSKLSKVKEVKRVHQRHGLKKQRQKLREERQLASVPRRGSTWSHAPEAAETHVPDPAAVAEANARRLLAMSAALSGVSTGAINEHQLASKRTYTPKCRLMEEKMRGGKAMTSTMKKRQAAEGATLFSDQDFEDFSKEYFGFSEPVSQKTIKARRKKQEDDEYH